MAERSLLNEGGDKGKKHGVMLMKKEYIFPVTDLVVLTLNQHMLGGDEVITFSNVQEVSGGEVGAKENADFFDDDFKPDDYFYFQSIWDDE
jgi:hypothetical protein